MQIVIQYEDRRITLNVKDHVSGRRVMEYLWAQNWIPDREYAGIDQVLLLRGIPIDMFCSLAENGVHDGDALEVAEVNMREDILPLYGCPSAKDLAGIAPACMLTRAVPAEAVRL